MVNIRTVFRQDAASFHQTIKGAHDLTSGLFGGDAIGNRALRGTGTAIGKTCPAERGAAMMAGWNVFPKLR